VLLVMGQKVGEAANESLKQAQALIQLLPGA
jgi:hypothetical protein